MLYILIPTYNERENIELLLSSIASVRLPEHRILIIDDSSPDGTGELADELATRMPALAVLHRAKKEGLGRAYAAGFRRALDEGATSIVTMDADLSHDPRYLPALLAEATGHDLVLGSRYIPGGAVKNWGWFRRFLSAGANRLARAMLRLDVSDMTTGYRCYSRRLLEAIGPESIRTDGYAFLVEMVANAQWLGYDIAQVPISFVNRTLGRSKISRKEVIFGFLALWRLRRGRKTGE